MCIRICICVYVPISLHFHYSYKCLMALHGRFKSRMLAVMLLVSWEVFGGKKTLLYSLYI